jgi:chemotaxis protein MotB
MERYRAETTVMNKPMAIIGVVAILGLGLSGCVSSGTHEQTLAELDKARKAAAQQAEVNKGTLAERAARIAALEQEKTLISNELLAAQSAQSSTKAQLVRSTQLAEQEQASSRQLRDQVIKSQEEIQKGNVLSGEVRRERDQLLAVRDDLERKLATSQQQAKSTGDSLSASQEQLTALSKEKGQIMAALDQATNQVRNLNTRLDAEQAQVASLQGDKQRLLSGTTTAQDEMARLQKRAGVLETEAARVKDLEKLVAEKTQTIGQLRQASGDRDMLATQMSAQGEELRVAKVRIAELTTELAGLGDNAVKVKGDRDSLAGQVRTLEQEKAAQAAEIKQLYQAKDTLTKAVEQERAARDVEMKSSMEKQMAMGRTLGAEEATRANLEKERVMLSSELTRLSSAQADLAKTIEAQRVETAKLGAEKAKLDEERKAQEAEVAALTKAKGELLGSLEEQKAAKLKLEQEKAAKDAEIAKLTSTYEDLTGSLRAEIAQGDVKIQQVRDRLTINMVDRILFDSGSTKIKPAGLKVLKQVGDALKKVTDKQIRIEGHTDNVPIGSGLKGKFPTNWELSTARATSVVRELIDGGVAPEFLTAAGRAETKPVSSNDSEEGRSQNRRIEIALYPKDLAGIAKAVSDR